MTLCTTVENQAVAVVEVVEGESAAARENQTVASVTLPLAPAPFPRTPCVLLVGHSVIAGAVAENGGGGGGSNATLALPPAEIFRSAPEHYRMRCV